ncbi:MAG: family 43 glycosylhydrolase [Labilibaculum sp.]|nr:family 43 glycosylhydrolase [Labilibaculum sp.]MBI9057112.1 family 43 glycosylhydrolase [Labilibaculum sp.]
MKKLGLSLLMIILFAANFAIADNPLVRHMYTADPTARVMNGKVFVFPSTDIKCEEGKGNNGFCMPIYHVFSSENLFDWTDHGVIIDQADVKWGVFDGFGMWAPDCIEKEGKYYYYFPDMPKDTTAFRRIGVAVADNPEGPYTLEDDYMKGLDGIDPNVFIDTDGQAYLYWGGGEKLYGAKLKANMKELASEPVVINDLPSRYKEGSFVFERNGIYYFTFPHSPHGTEELAYATGDNPLGPFEYQGFFMKRWTNGCWTNHHSIVEYKGQWMVFYHHKDISDNEHLRSMCADNLNFNEDGSIQEVIPTLRGIGVCPATNEIQIDRYSRIGEKEIQVNRIGSGLPANWQLDYITNDSWVAYDRVNFEDGNLTEVEINCASAAKGGSVEVRIGGATGKLLAVVKITNTGGWNQWKTFNVKLDKKVSGIQNLVCVFKGEEGNLFNVDWIKFK